MKTLAVDDDDMDVRGNALRTLLMVGASDSFTNVVKAVLAGEDTEFKEEVLVILVESSKEVVLLVKAELEAIAKGSNKEMAEDAKLALKLLDE